MIEKVSNKIKYSASTIGGMILGSLLTYQMTKSPIKKMSVYEHGIRKVIKLEAKYNTDLLIENIDKINYPEYNNLESYLRKIENPAERLIEEGKIKKLTNWYD